MSSSEVPNPNYAGDVHGGSNSTINMYPIEGKDVSKMGSTVPIAPKKLDYDPYEHRDISHPTSDAETMIHLLKGCLGTGLLAMPYAFSHAGLIFGFFATIFVGLMTTYCVNILMKCNYILCQRTKVPSLGFAELAETGFAAGPPKLRRYSSWAKGIINGCLIADLLGCCCVYVIFVANNLKPVCEAYLPDWTIREYILLLLPFLIAVNLIRNLKYLAPFSLAANVLLLASLVIIFYYIFADWNELVPVPAIVSVEKFPLFFGTVIFGLEGVGVVMPLENSMRHPKHFVGCPGVLNIGFGTVVFLYTFLGFVGFLRYGMAVEDSISLNLPDSPLAQSAKVMVAIAIFCTYALQFYVPLEIIWKYIKHRCEARPVLAECSLKTAFVIFTVLVAVAFPNLGALMSLVGAITLSILGLIFPSILELIVLYDDENRYGRFQWILWKNVFIICFGILGLVTGSEVSINELIKSE